MMENGGMEWGETVLGPLFQPNTSSFKGKNRKKCTEKLQAVKENEAAKHGQGRTAVCSRWHGRVSPTTVRAHHHGQTVWCLALPFRRFPNAAFWCSFWSVGSALDLLPWAYWASSC